MARLIFIAGGAITGIFIAYITAVGIGWVLGPLYAGEEDMVRNVKIFLGGSVVAAIACGWIANRVYTRMLTDRSSGRPNGRR